MSRTAVNPHPRSLRVVFRDEATATGTADQYHLTDGCIVALTGDESVASSPMCMGPVAGASPGSSRLQRVFDVVAAIMLLVVCAPLFLLIILLSKVFQPGPVFFRQERVGRNSRPFQMLKFRSMRVDAERNTGPVFAVSNDPRCTRLGGWLRRTCCDELPQLLNVLLGEMSLVGPRPERPCFVDQFRGCIPRYDERHTVRPGITGWAQINGWRGDPMIEERLQFDLEYVRRRSLLFDLQILLRTPGAILLPKRTYPNGDSTSLYPVQSGRRTFGIVMGSRSDGVQLESVVRRAA